MNLASPAKLPAVIENEESLEEVLTRPGAPLVQFIKTLPSPLLILGAGGKMGPSLAVLARRAAQAAQHPLEVIAVSRFSNPAARSQLERQQVKTISCDLLDRSAMEKLPDAGAIIYLAGMKFGATQNPSLTWALNTIAPLRVAERFPRVPIVALSSGNVYALSDVRRAGSVETDPLTPLGEYANSVIGRERIFEYYSRTQGTPLALIRLFYAVDLRYGVPVDIARRVLAGEPIDLTNGCFNCIWQGDANDLILRSLSLAASPPSAWNLCRPEILSVRAIATRFGELLGRPPKFVGTESPTALLGNSARLCAKLGPPALPLDTMLNWIAAWVQRGGRNLDKPTHFEVRDGSY